MILNTKFTQLFFVCNTDLPGGQEIFGMHNTDCVPNTQTTGCQKLSYDVLWMNRYSSQFHCEEHYPRIVAVLCEMLF